MRDPMIVSCSGWEEKLAVLHSDGLSLAECEALTKHIASCEACATVFHDYLEMDNLIRHSLTTDHPLELRKDLLPVQPIQGCNPRSPLDLTEDPNTCYLIRISALCWTRYTEVLPDEQQGEEVIVEIFVGQALRGLFEKVTMENVSLHFNSPELPTKHPHYSIQIAAQCHLPLEPRAPQAMELMIEDTVSAFLQELFGVAIVDEVTIDCSSKHTHEEVREQTALVSRTHL